MSVLEVCLLLLAAFAAGTINAIVGSGSLITFPTLLAIGYVPVVANVSNTVGITFGAMSGSVGYRRELSGQQHRVRVLASASLLGGVTGGVLLLTLPSAVFDAVIPVLILGACVLVMLQPRISAAVTARRATAVEHGGLPLWIGIFLTGVYGGYFGAAQGVILISLLGIFIADTLQRLNGVKNVLALVANGVAAILFVLVADVAWEVVVVVAIGSVIGGQVGAHVGRRLSPRVLRAVVVVIGLIAAVKLLVA